MLQASNVSRFEYASTVDGQRGEARSTRDVYRELRAEADAQDKARGITRKAGARDSDGWADPTRYEKISAEAPRGGTDHRAGLARMEHELALARIC